jgi:hypothetical protein
MNAEKMLIHVIDILRPASMKLVATDVNLSWIQPQMKIEPQV